jgi:PHD/YefM family antitoxin component YafN of YafNO toxin-antitoxin module
MSSSFKSDALKSLADLPRARASDLKKLGWRGMMLTLRSKGRVVVTNHDEPEAVIMPAAEYDAFMQVVRQAEAKAESTLATLRADFDERLSVLNTENAAVRLRATMRGRTKLGGKVKAGMRY